MSTFAKELRRGSRRITFHRRRTEDRAAAEDITSQVFVQALGAIGRFEWRGLPVSVWLFRIASNALADHWRERARTAQEAPGVPDPHELEDIERRIALYQLVEQLPELQRQVIRMRFVEEKSIREVAAALNRSEGAVKQLLVHCDAVTRGRFSDLNLKFGSQRHGVGPAALPESRRSHRSRIVSGFGGHID